MTISVSSYIWTSCSRDWDNDTTYLTLLCSSTGFARFGDGRRRRRRVRPVWCTDDLGGRAPFQTACQTTERIVRSRCNNSGPQLLRVDADEARCVHPMQARSHDVTSTSALSQLPHRPLCCCWRARAACRTTSRRCCYLVHARAQACCSCTSALFSTCADCVV